MSRSGTIKASTGSSGMVKRFTAYDLEETWELDDVCPGPPNPRSATTSRCCIRGPRALEPDFWEFEKPMVGLARTISAKLKSNPSKSLLDLIGGTSNLVLAPNSALRPIRGRPPRATGSSTTTRPR